MGKSLLPDEVRGAYPVEEWHFPAWSKTLVEVLNEFKLGHSKERQQKRTDAADYSRMSYEELRTLADNDSVADTMSNEEYESLSVALWRKFSAEKLTLEPLDTDAANTSLFPESPV
jgi:hypothetical protein